MKPRKVQIVTDYFGDLSVNHYKYKYYTKREVAAWMQELGWLIKPLDLKEWRLPITVRCDGRFKDKRSCPDISNLAKVCLDAIEAGSGVNDKYFRWQDGDLTYGEPPVLWITLIEGKLI